MANFLVELMIANTDFTLEEIREMTSEEIDMHLGYQFYKINTDSIG